MAAFILYGTIRLYFYLNARYQPEPWQDMKRFNEAQLNAVGLMDQHRVFPATDSDTGSIASDMEEAQGIEGDDQETPQKGLDRLQAIDDQDISDLEAGKSQHGEAEDNEFADQSDIKNRNSSDTSQQLQLDTIVETETDAEQTEMSIFSKLRAIRDSEECDGKEGEEKEEEKEEIDAIPDIAEAESKQEPEAAAVGGEGGGKKGEEGEDEAAREREMNARQERLNRFRKAGKGAKMTSMFSKLRAIRDSEEDDGKEEEKEAEEDEKKEEKEKEDKESHVVMEEIEVPDIVEPESESKPEAAGDKGDEGEDEDEGEEGEDEAARERERARKEQRLDRFKKAGKGAKMTSFFSKLRAIRDLEGVQTQETSIAEERGGEDAKAEASAQAAEVSGKEE